MTADYVCQILCFKKSNLVKVGTFAWNNILIRVIFGVRFENPKVEKKQIYMKTETCKLYSRDIWNVIKIDQI